MTLHYRFNCATIVVDSDMPHLRETGKDKTVLKFMVKSRKLKAEETIDIAFKWQRGEINIHTVSQEAGVESKMDTSMIG